MERKINKESLGLGIALLLIGLVLFVSALKLPAGSSMDVGASFMPKVISGALAVLGACFIISAFLSRKEVKSGAAYTQNEVVRLLITFALLFVYIFFLKKIGFIIMTVFYIIAQSWFITPPEDRKPVRLVILAVVSTLIIYAVFVFGFKLLLPAGILG